MKCVCGALELFTAVAGQWYMILRRLLIVLVVAVVLVADADACGRRVLALRELVAEIPVIALVTVIRATPDGPLVRVDEMLKGGGAQGVGREIVLRTVPPSATGTAIAFLRFNEHERAWEPEDGHWSGFRPLPDAA